MLQTETKLEEDIERSLDRLKIVIKDISAVPSIPAFYYSVSSISPRHLYLINMPNSMDLKVFDPIFLRISKNLFLTLGNMIFPK